MRESCSCGAAIHTLSYKAALLWRYSHQHVAGDITELESETSFPTGFTVELEDEDE